MSVYDKDGNEHQYRGGRSLNSGQILLKVRYAHLARLFNCSNWTVKRWVRLKLLDPTSLLDIIDKYNNRWKLDGRRKRKD